MPRFELHFEQGAPLLRRSHWARGQPGYRSDARPFESVAPTRLSVCGGCSGHALDFFAPPHLPETWVAPAASTNAPSKILVQGSPSFPVQGCETHRAKFFILNPLLLAAPHEAINHPSKTYKYRASKR